MRVLLNRGSVEALAGCSGNWCSEQTLEDFSSIPHHQYLSVPKRGRKFERLNKRKKNSVCNVERKKILLTEPKKVKIFFACLVCRPTSVRGKEMELFLSKMLENFSSIVDVMR